MQFEVGLGDRSEAVVSARQTLKVRLETLMTGWLTLLKKKEKETTGVAGSRRKKYSASDASLEKG